MKAYSGKLEEGAEGEHLFIGAVEVARTLNPDHFEEHRETGPDVLSHFFEQVEFLDEPFYSCSPRLLSEPAG
jgi:hypothetical protein